MKVFFNRGLTQRGGAATKGDFNAETQRRGGKRRGKKSSQKNKKPEGCSADEHRFLGKLRFVFHVTICVNLYQSNIIIKYML
jgi:hypothetical protein